MNAKKSETKKVSFVESLIILLLLLAILGYLIIFQKLSPHVPILFVFMILLFYGRIRGFSWDEIQSGIISGISSGIVPIIIFILIGVLVSTWIMSGTIPTIMAYGFKIISVKFFLPTVFIVCSLVGITVGSSFTTISTMGIAFLGIGHILEFDNAITAGAIVSGAFLGNNISPLSDTTNLAASIGEVNLFTHIMNVMWTAIPGFIISFLGYMFIGTPNGNANLNSLNDMIKTLNSSFHISVITLLPLVFLFLFAWKKVPAIPTLLVGSTIAIILSIINEPSLNIQKISNTIMNGYIANTGDQSLDNLLSRGGIMSMLGSACLIILALALGGLLIKFEIVSTLINKIKDFVNNAPKLIGLTTLSSIMINILVGEQYLSIILPGKTFKDSFDSIGLSKKYLTRTLADAGTAVNAIIPWGVSGTFIMGALKVSTFSIFSICFLSITLSNNNYNIRFDIKN